jgi:hypothetical protein
MSPQSRNVPEQEQSIKDRAHELFVEVREAAPRPTKPFSVYLRETPAQPFSTFTQVVFWMLGIVVATLFLAALWRVSHRHLATPRTAPPPVNTAQLRGPGPLLSL